jgi:hypothetical protein
MMRQQRYFQTDQGFAGLGPSDMQIGQSPLSRHMILHGVC